jgi:hypothetical protein
MMYQVILERKIDNYIEKSIVVEVQSEEHARAVVSYLLEQRPPVLTKLGQMERLAIQESSHVWSEDVFRVV